MEAVLLGVNDIGMRIYEWLCKRPDGPDTQISAFVTTAEQLDLVDTLEPYVVISVGLDHLIPPEVLAVPRRVASTCNQSTSPKIGANPRTSGASSK